MEPTETVEVELQNKTLVLIKLKEVSALAASLAYNIENNKLWDRDLSQKIHSIVEALDSARKASKEDWGY